MVKVAVVARHGINRNIGRGFVKGFGLKRGAIASSVGHDSHNICVVGADDADMAVGGEPADRAAGRLRRRLRRRGSRRARAADRRPDERASLRGRCATRCIRSARAARALGCTLAEPFLQVAFLPLPVIPHLKITDRGLVDVDRMELVRD